jgi:hypothetical protein
MNKLFAFLVLAAVTCAPSVAQSAMSTSMIGVGPHGYDWLIGSWSCNNSVPSAMGGPAAIALTVSRAPGGSLSVHVSGTNFDGLGYVAYDAKTKTWWNPSAFPTGDYSSESTQQTGEKTVWTGPYYNAAAGKSMPIRDTYTIENLTTYNDLSEIEIDGTWKTQANITCTKS